MRSRCCVVLNCFGLDLIGLMRLRVAFGSRDSCDGRWLIPTITGLRSASVRDKATHGVSDLEPGSILTLEATALVAGGDAIGRLDDGRVVFIAGALAGERVVARVVEVKRDFVRSRVQEVVVAAPERVSPCCPEIERGCGGCDFAYVRRVSQPGLKVDIVVDALRRLGRISDPVVVAGPALAVDGFRTTVRAAVVNGRAGFRAARSHDVIDVARCGVAHPAIEELLVDGFFGDASEVTLRVGARTGERLVFASPTLRNARLPDDVLVVAKDDSRLSPSEPGTHDPGRFDPRNWYHEIVDGRVFRISATSFFQTSTDGAEVLVQTVRRMAGDVLALPGLAIDAYCGVGLFASCFASPLETPVDQARRFLAVERNASSVVDARHNLRDRHAHVVEAAVEDLTLNDPLGTGGIDGGAGFGGIGETGGYDGRPPPFTSPVDLVVADPARSGLGGRGVEALSATGAQRLILVSCDPAALGRDARLLEQEGYRFIEAELVDMFPDTHHVEVVSRFDRLE